ncbi:hypothetical protein MA16_Dca003411 [Dendrobium catenatum]|uniref:Uncharacterized protein n=1 Tax=Dendrobium catenatum TaxID=906689 RepID=A0A2I0XCN4_9ASPA|nr:hypothetical protein MA16_Dca003411 [Dendrobium catenatum]
MTEMVELPALKGQAAFSFTPLLLLKRSSSQNFGVKAQKLQMSSSSRSLSIKRSPSRDFLHIIPRKKLIYDGTIRLTKCMSYPRDEFLEEKSRSNEFFRCCLHEWSWYEDDSLWDTYHEVIKCRHPMYVNGETITDLGWQFVRQKFRDHNGHFAPISTLKTRISKITKQKDGSVVVNVVNPITDVQHCILYKE